MPPAESWAGLRDFTVADEWQGRGPGTALVQALMQRRPAAVRRLHAAIDACNPRMPATHQARKQNRLICGLKDAHRRPRVTAKYSASICAVIPGHGCICERIDSPLCRHHHRCKQSEGWHLEQPEPGLLVWRVPSGRTYATTRTEYQI